MDMESLDTLAEAIYGFVYDRVIHGRERLEMFTLLRESIATLSEDEKAYVDARVQEYLKKLTVSKEESDKTQKKKTA